MADECPAQTITEFFAWVDENLRRAPEVSRREIHRWLVEAEACRSREQIAWLNFYLGWLAIDGDDFDQAFEILGKARAIFEELGNAEALARTINAIGATYDLCGIFDLALDHFKESAEIAERLGRKDIAGTAVMNMADSLHSLGEHEEALRAIVRCRTELIIRPISRSIVHLTAGRALRMLGRLGEAEEELRQAVDLSLDRPHDHLESRRHLAELYLDRGRLQDAEAEIRTAMEGAESRGERLMLAQLRLSQARWHQLQGQHQRALEAIVLASQAAKELKARPVEADAEKAAFDSWQACGEPQKALAAFIRHTEIKDAMKGVTTSRRIASLQSERSRRDAKHFESLYRQVSIISEIGRRITSNLHLDQVLDDIYGSVNGIMSAPTLMIGFLNERERRLEYPLAIVNGERLDSFQSSLDSGTLECQCVLDRKDILVMDWSLEHPGCPNTLGLAAQADCSQVIVPLLIGDRVEGVISVHSPKRAAYSKQEVETVRAIGAYVAIAVENSSLFQQVQTLASIDGLTGLLNRRCLAEAVAKDFRKCKRYKTPASLIMVDIDHFKRVNDQHGHDAGDLVIKKTADVLSSMVRTCDAAGRFGGEEFVLFLPETGMDGALVLAERLRAAVQALQISVSERQVVGITISLGVSAFRPGDDSWEASLKRADAALYRSKHDGRNRVTAGD